MIRPFVDLQHHFGVAWEQAAPFTALDDLADAPGLWGYDGRRPDHLPWEAIA